MATISKTTSGVRVTGLRGEAFLSVNSDHGRPTSTLNYYTPTTSFSIERLTLDEITAIRDALTQHIEAIEAAQKVAA